MVVPPLAGAVVGNQTRGSASCQFQVALLVGARQFGGCNAGLKCFMQMAAMADTSLTLISGTPPQSNRVVLDMAEAVCAVEGHNAHCHCIRSAQKLQMVTTMVTCSA